MKATLTLILCSFAFSGVCFPDPASPMKRDEVLNEINACLRRNEVSSRQCKHLNKNVEALVNVYWRGDKSVLPTLFRFTYLTDFYGDALFADPDEFLTAASHLNRKGLQELASGLAGGMFRLRSHERFDSLRSLLRAIPDSSPAKGVAQTCLKNLEITNASWFVDYFPPHTFTGSTADFRVAWFSRDMFSLGEEPLWPVPSGHATTYRLTYLGAFTGPRVIKLIVPPSGTALVSMKALGQDQEVEQIVDSSSVPQDQLIGFSTRLDQAHFWDLPSESQSRGFDGAEWILEATQKGSYKIVVRWCPQIVQSSPQESEFAAALQMLFEIAGQKHTATC